MDYFETTPIKEGGKYIFPSLSTFKLGPEQKPLQETLIRFY